MNSEEQDKEIYGIIERYYSDDFFDGYQSTLSLLKDIHLVCGDVPEYALDLICTKFNLKKTYLVAIIDKTPTLASTNVNTVIICTGPRCANKNSHKFLEYAHKCDNINVKFKNCMKQCNTSPNVVINKKQYFGITLEQFKLYLKEFK